MIKNEVRLRELLKCDSNVSTEQLERMSYEILRDMKVIFDTSTERGVKNIAKRKIALINEVYELDSDMYKPEEIFNNESEKLICRHIRETLMSESNLNKTIINDLKYDISGYKSAEALYLQAVLTIREMDYYDGNFEIKVTEAEEFIKNACQIDPGNALYKEVARGIEEIQEELKRIKKEVEVEKKRRAEQQLVNKQKEIEKDNIVSEKAEKDKGLRVFLIFSGLCALIYMGSCGCNCISGCTG